MKPVIVIVTNANEFRIIGMSRSGNHAVINWITQQLDGRYCFLNCAEPKTNPFETARPYHGAQSYLVNYDDFDLQAEQQGRFSRKDYLLHSYEDCFLGMVCSDVFEHAHDAYVGSSAHRIDLLILRDPFNLFASRRKASYATITARTAARIWKQHAREFLQRRYLNQERILIRYNAWARDPAYRRHLAEQLGLRFTDAGIDTLSRCGGGSSFDGRRFDGRASAMQVHERWRHFADDPAYWALFDSEVIQLAEELFGPGPAVPAPYPA